MAFTETKMFETIVGNKIFGCYKLTGDASDTAWSAPLDTIDAAWLDPATSDAGTSCSFATNVVTIGRTLRAAEYVLVFYIGV